MHRLQNGFELGEVRFLNILQQSIVQTQQTLFACCASLGMGVLLSRGETHMHIRGNDSMENSSNSFSASPR